MLIPLSKHNLFHYNRKPAALHGSHKILICGAKDHKKVIADKLAASQRMLPKVL
jgi:hypothetical protein